MKLSYTPSPLVCSRQIDVKMNDDGTIANVEFFGGCPGNLTAISRLVKGMPATKAIEILHGIRCGGKATSCADQLTIALQQCLDKKG